MMNGKYRTGAGLLQDARGFALITVLIFALIAGITGLAFYAMASWEFKGASDRQHSSEAFYLAEAGIEQARGEFLVDNRWRGPIGTTDLGSGSYSVSVMDTVWNGEDAVFLRSEAHVEEGARGIEVLGEVAGLFEVVALFANRNFTANGNLSVYDQVHVNGNGDFGPNDVHLQAGSYDDGYIIEPPPVFVHPDSFPASTFYRVVGVPIEPQYKAHVLKYDRPSKSWAVIDSLDNKIVRNYDSVLNMYEFEFRQASDFATYETLFIQDPGDTYVVIDFGQGDVNGSISNIDFNTSSFVVEETIINSRFEGISEADRVEPCGGWWKGGYVSFGSLVLFKPKSCVALIANILGPDKGQQPNAQGKLGTADNPALTYITGNVNGLKGDLEVHGVFVSLCDINSQGGPDVFHAPEVLDCIPQGVLGESGAGFLRFLEWREVGL